MRQASWPQRGDAVPPVNDALYFEQQRKAGDAALHAQRHPETFSFLTGDSKTRSSENFSCTEITSFTRPRTRMRIQERADDRSEQLECPGAMDALNVGVA